MLLYNMHVLIVLLYNLIVTIMHVCLRFEYILYYQRMYTNNFYKFMCSQMMIQNSKYKKYIIFLRNGYSVECIFYCLLIV